MEEMENKDLQKEEPQQEETVAEETPKYIPRPAWQVWGARVALVLFIVVIILYMIKISRGGL